MKLQTMDVLWKLPKKSSTPQLFLQDPIGLQSHDGTPFRLSIHRRMSSRGDSATQRLWWTVKSS
jgi:hypothetical protein